MWLERIVDPFRGLVLNLIIEIVQTVAYSLHMCFVCMIMILAGSLAATVHEIGIADDETAEDNDVSVDQQIRT